MCFLGRTVRVLRRFCRVVLELGGSCGCCVGEETVDFVVETEEDITELIAFGPTESQETGQEEAE